VATKIYRESEEAGFRVLYDAVSEKGVVVQVVDMLSGEIKEIKYEGEIDLPRPELMKRARQAANNLAEQLDGTVFIGYDPSILSKVLLEGE